MQFSRLILVRQNFPDRRLADIPGEVRGQLTASSFAARLKPGSRIALGVGSRGVANIAIIARTAVDYWKSARMQPFIFPAMGSHGGATAAGQASVLAKYGITEATMGCPVVSQLEVVPIGKTPEGIEVVMDRAAYEADAVMPIARVKWHTDIEGTIESGVFKMMAIGMGKLIGAKRYHSHGYKLGLANVVRSVGRHVAASGKIIGGLAILEDAYHNTAKVEALPLETMEQREEENLALAKSWMARIPVDLDILIVDEMGKHISGTGMDTKVVNRTIKGAYNPFSYAPIINRIFCRELSPLSYGNGVGVGMADIVTDRLVNRIDWTPTYVNSLTSSTPAGVRTPIHFATDRECVERLSTTVGKFEPGEVTFGWIHDTLELGRIALSENLRSQIEANPALEIVGEPRDFEFDSEDNLVSLVAPAGDAASAH